MNTISNFIFEIFVKTWRYPDYIIFTGEYLSYAKNMLLSVKAAPQIAHGYTAGWGHAPDNILRQFHPK